MQYFINIPQINIAEQYPKLNVTHGAILSYMQQFIGTGKIERHEEDGKTWYWFAINKIIDDLPMLRIKDKSTMIRKINQIIEHSNLIEERKTECNKTYYSFTENFFKLYSGDAKVLENSKTLCGNIPTEGVGKFQDNNNTNINIPKSNIYIKECFERFWKAYPNAKAEHRLQAEKFFTYNQLHAQLPRILKAISHYKQTKASQTGYGYSAKRFLEEIYPTYVNGIPDDIKKAPLNDKKFRDEAVKLLEKVAWLNEKWDSLSAENKKIVCDSNGAVVTKDKKDVFSKKEVKVIGSVGGIYELINSFTTKSTKEQIERLMGKIKRN